MNDLTIERHAIANRGRRLEYFTIAWNTLEGLVAVAAGVIAGSISLVGFGMDSFIEVTSGATLLWRMSVDADVERRERNEKLSLRIVGVCFIALAVYITYEALVDLIRNGVATGTLLTGTSFGVPRRSHRRRLVQSASPYCMARRQRLSTAFLESHWPACPSSSCRFCHAPKRRWAMH
jgi:hypothetical protein